MTLDRIAGALFGLAIGDALGATTEFMKPDEIQEQYGLLRDIVGGGWLQLRKGETTDDTAMALAVAKGILRKPKDPIVSIGQEFIEWFKNDPVDVGGQTMMVLGQVPKRKRQWFKASQRAAKGSSHTAGNGSLMRALPVALAYSDLNTVLDITKQQSEMTHWDDLCTEACWVYNAIAYEMLNNEMPLKEAIVTMTRGTSYKNCYKEFPKAPPSGFVVNTLKWVLYMLYTSDSFDHTVIRIANQGGDADTIAAIAGGLAGLECGYRNLPARWTNALLLKHELHIVADGLFELRCEQ